MNSATTDMRSSKRSTPRRPVRRIRAVRRARSAPAAEVQAADWYLQEALASGIRVKILLRMHAHSERIYQAAREAAHSAAEWLGAKDRRRLGGLDSVQP